MLEFVEGKIRVVLLEVEDVLDVGAAETVNRLRIVTDHTEVLTQGRELLDDEVLGEVGVLVLVHQDVRELVLVLQKQIGEIPQQHVHLEQEVVEVHGLRPKTPVLISAVNLRDARPAGLVVFRHDLGMVGVPAGVDEVVFGVADPGLDASGLVDLVVHAQAFDDVLDECPAVLGVVNGEVARVVDSLALHAEDAGKNAVERPHPNVAGLAFTDNSPNALLHLARRLVGERQRQNGERVHAFLNEIGNPISQHPGLSRTRSGDDHHGAFFMPGGCLLCLVQFVQKIHTSKVRRGVDKAMIQPTSSPTCLKVVFFGAIA